MEAQFSILNGRWWFFRPPSTFCRKSIHSSDRWSFHQVAWSDRATRSVSSGNNWSPHGKLDHPLWLPREPSLQPGTYFEAELFTSLTKLLQLDKTRTIAFHPQSNEVIERTNRTQLNMLAKTTDKNQRNWSELLPYVMLAYRISVHESTGYTPYFLLFSHEATLPINLQFSAPSDATWTNYREYVAETRLRFHTAYEQTRQYLKGQQKRQHALYNAKVHCPRHI